MLRLQLHMKSDTSNSRIALLIITVTLSVGQSVSQSVSRLTSQLVSQSIGRSVSLLVSQSVGQSVVQSVIRLMTQSLRQSVTYSVKHFVSLSISHRGGKFLWNTETVMLRRWESIIGWMIRMIRSDEVLALENSALKLFTVANLRY